MKKILAIILLLTTIHAETLQSLYPKVRGNSFIWIELDQNEALGRLRYISEYGAIEHDTMISAGAYRHRTPSGIYRVQVKKRRWMSTKYPEPSGRNNMDYSLFFKGGYAIHSGNPRASSHGCIHVHPSIAPYLYASTKHQTLVIITRNDEYIKVSGTK